MKDITELVVSETIVCRPDTIPFRELITASNLKTFAAPFVFKNIDVSEDENKNLLGIVMQTGEFKHDGKVFPVELLLIERAKIIFKIHATSEIADNFSQSIFKSLSEIDPYGQFKQSKPSIKIVTTTCVATLDFDYNNIFSKKMNVFINKRVSGACSSAINNIARVQVLPRSLTFNINYSITDKSLLESNLKIETRQLIIEPRVGVSLKERRFFTSSPTDSKTHLQLLTELENSFIRSKSR